MKKYKLGLHIFRRDLRLEDNTSLIYNLENSDKVICCFIFDERQYLNNSYKSDFAFSFMINSLKELKRDLEKKGSDLFIFSGNPKNIVRELIDFGVDFVSFNEDYTPFSIQRDLEIENVCLEKKISFKKFFDVLLNHPSSVLKSDGKTYVKFTPYYRRAKLLSVNSPILNKFKNYYEGKISFVNRKILNSFSFDLNSSILKGGRDEGLELLKKSSSLFDYDKKRDFPSLSYTSLLSAHNKFGTLSIREVYHRMKEVNETFLSEIYWRDFFVQIGFHFPHVLGSCFNEKYNAIKWQKNEKLFNSWKEGLTGFPIVDAGMRELKETGFMHNRVRMIVASFLVKDLHIDWRLGEKYFATKLIDYDPLVNNGNWQWASSTGCDAQPYFRIFNPWLQQKRFDFNCEYIKKWVPELKNISCGEIHKIEFNPLNLKDYPNPIVNHKEEKELALMMYKFL